MIIFYINLVRIYLLSNSRYFGSHGSQVNIPLMYSMGIKSKTIVNLCYFPYR